MNSCSRLLVLVAVLTGLWSGDVFARDLHGSLGLGYNGQFANSSASLRVPGVSIKYGLTRDIALEAIVGVATTNPANSVVGLKFFKNLLYETDLNFYFMLGGGILSAGGRSGAEFLGGFGVEFFIPGLPSLGFAVETGGEFDNMTGNFSLKTMGVSFLDAGIHFYF